MSDAIFRLEEAVELTPGTLDAHELLGEAYYRDNDLPSARMQWDYVLGQEPKRPGLDARYEKAFREESVEQNFKRRSSVYFDITYPPGVSVRLRSRVMRILDLAYLDIGRRFGGEYPTVPIHVILYSADQFTEATLLEGHVGAVFDGKIRAPLTDEKGETLPEDELKRRLTHEFVHVVVRYISADKAPWWLNEGLAETFSRDIKTEETRFLRALYREGKNVPLAQLEASQLDQLSPVALGMAYRQAHATVNSLWTRFGRIRLTRFMDDLAAGVPPEEALQRQYRKTYHALESEVAASYR